MRIKQISIKDLFGIFNHTIPLNLNERITIIHGPNGYGKTVILKIIDEIFRGKYSEIFKIPFSMLTIEFDDNSILSVSRSTQSKLLRTVIIDGKIENKNVDDVKLVFVYKKIGLRQSKKYEISSLKNRQEYRDVRSVISHTIPFITQMSHDIWSDDRTDEIYTTDEVLERYSSLLPSHLLKIEKEKNWLAELQNSVDIRFIETQRLFSFKRNRRRREVDEKPPESVINYSKELVDRIQQNLSLYATNSQNLDRTFPKRLLTGEKSIGLTKDELKNNLNLLEKKRSHLFELGLLDKQEEIDFGDLESKFTENNRMVLSVYIKDVQDKLSVFDELSKKIDILLLIIKSKFEYKKMTIDKKEGFVFNTDNQEKLSSTSLSSGEQHELILLNELLFNVKPDSLILIDEPELSLHIIWQQQFLTDLEKIIDLVKFDVLIATHAPEIINDKSNLTVQLKGP